MTEYQEIIAEEIIKKHRAEKGKYHLNDLRQQLLEHFERMDDILAAWEALKKRGIIEELEATKYTRLTEKGWFFPGFQEERRQKEREEIIKDLQIKNLKGSIFQIKYWWLLMKYWWLLMLVSALLGAIVNKLIEFFIGNLS